MATKPKTHPYAVMYNDNTHVIYEFSNAQYDLLCNGIAEEKRGVVLPDIGILVLSDIRSVVKQKEPEPVQDVAPAADPTLSPEEMAWVMQYRDMVQSGKDGYN